MKKYYIGFCFLLAFMMTKAQETTPGVIINYSGLEKKLERSNEAIQNPKKNTDPKTWISRAEALLEIYNVHLDYIRKEMPAAQVKLFFGEPKEKRQVNGGVEEHVYDRITIKLENGVVKDWEETNKIHEKPLPEAKEALKKATELDTEGKNASKIKENVEKLKSALENEAILNYSHKDYTNSYSNFKSILEINEWPVMKGVVDTVIYYSAGRAAKEIGNNEEAANYFKKAIELNFNDPFLYVFAAHTFMELTDSVKGLETLKTGFEKYPENQSIQIELINYYLLRNEGEKALEFLQVAKENDPGNVSFIFAEGTIYDKMGKTEDAIASYQKCLDINPDYFNANYNMSVVHFNKAVKIQEDCQKIEDVKKYEECFKTSVDEIHAAIPYMEKAKDVSSGSQKCDAMNTLKTLYYRTQQEDKMKILTEEITASGCN